MGLDIERRYFRESVYWDDQKYQLIEFIAYLCGS